MAFHAFSHGFERFSMFFWSFNGFHDLSRPERSSFRSFLSRAGFVFALPVLSGGHPGSALLLKSMARSGSAVSVLDLLRPGPVLFSQSLCRADLTLPWLGR